ncbi:hypothetical protein MHU86_947 [Fragilaria crotonensis]|nr:hypothetical protein MHU86_947 [Fragilaria crotonensis]
MPTIATSKKRTFAKVTEDSHETDDATTKESQPSNTLFESTTFLACHLKVLRALYITTKTTAADLLDDSTLSDETVSEEVWEMIERFLGQQHELRRMKRQANEWRAIADELKDDAQKEREQKQEHQLEQSHHQQQLPSVSKSPIQYQPTSPIEKRLFTSPYVRSPGTAPPTAATANTTTSGDAASKTIPTATCALTVTSNLLDRRARVAEKTARQVVRPYQELYIAVCHRSKRLDSFMASQSSSLSGPGSIVSNVASEDKDADNENATTRQMVSGQLDNDYQRRNSLYEIEAKNRLWKKLANDLYNVIQI